MPALLLQDAGGLLTVAAAPHTGYSLYLQIAWRQEQGLGAAAGGESGGGNWGYEWIPSFFGASCTVGAV